MINRKGIKRGALKLKLLLKKNWGINIDDIKIIRCGVSTNNWLLRSGSSTYIFRDAGIYDYYVKYQIELLQKLKKKKFSYFIPQPIKSKKSFYIKSGNNYLYLYNYIDGIPVNDNFTGKQIEQLAVMVGSYHKIIKKIYCPKVLRKKNIFNLKSAQKNLEKYFEISKTKRIKNRYDKLLIDNFVLLKDAVNRIRENEASEYNVLRRFACYADWNSGNILVDHNNKIIGLIDYGGIVREPIIFDVQNALKNVLIGKREASSRAVKKFMCSYEKINKLTLEEKRLIQPAMIADCITCLNWLFGEMIGRGAELPIVNFQRELEILKWLMINKFYFSRY